MLAGSAAYAIGEARRWPVGLAREPRETMAFYATLAIATLVGVALNSSPINPIKALYWIAVVNGVIAVPVMVVLMVITARRAIMAEFRVEGPLRVLGWVSTFVMGACVAAMAVSWFA